MMTDEKPLGSVVTVIMGTSPKGDTYNEIGNGMPLLNGPTEFGADHPNCTLYTTNPKRECEPNDLIFCVRGSTTGRMNWADKKYALGRGVCSFRGKTPEDTLFVRYVLEMKLPALLQFAGGSTFPNLTKDAINNFFVPFPEVRNSIVTILSNYDNLIENNRRRIELLEESARQLYKEWFVRFRFPGHEHVKIIDGVPEGWERCTASQALYINPKVAVEKGKEILYVPMASLSESQMTVDASKFEHRTKHTTVKFMSGDTLFARITPCLENGKTAYVDFLEENQIACGSTEFVVLRGKKVSNQFAYLLAREENFRGNAIKSMIGSSGRQRVQPSCFDKYVVPVAPPTIQEQFDEVVGLAFEQISVLSKQINQLEKARNLLLPKLMSGEIVV